ncbi:D-3-phosphoglycerate dehydrogenase [Mollisia scopiformis]|uniref:D-3-phosphoglycerate dehydrogenase n=1 Tax=Mollisia scopiformis TaxID=149040 RepID=A0A132B680_MOLSC|nr:D-3-phosphoglycerate dehydrogenase [Mollisia scopiformis]KUJ07910.1 D-3-phosphoglycerate dehydrogenase [Mollisia scopiformis]
MAFSSSEKPKVLALTPPKACGADYLEDFKSKFQLDILSVKNRAEAVPAIAEAVAKTGPYSAFIILMGTAPFEPFDGEFFTPLVPECKIVVSASAGYNEFPVNWLTDKGIWFCNTRNAVSEPTADMALFLTLAVCRDTTRAENSVRNGLWRNNHVPCTDPSDLIVGIIGLGAIGKHYARKVNAFNMKVQYHNRTRASPEIEALYGATWCPNLEELLRTSDVVSVSVPQNAETIGLISRNEFSQMKDGVFFINTARGPIVDEAALIAALESGKVARAGLDVFTGEPNVNPWFLKSDKVVIQPHLGGLTNRAWRDAERECFANIVALYETGRPVAPVNDIKPN